VATQKRDCGTTKSGPCERSLKVSVLALLTHLGTSLMLICNMNSQVGELSISVFEV
jgi:hypothetical protein